jgi:hypothetical protein
MQHDIDVFAGENTPLSQWTSLVIVQDLRAIDGSVVCMKGILD